MIYMLILIWYLLCDTITQLKPLQFGVGRQKFSSLVRTLSSAVELTPCVVIWDEGSSVPFQSKLQNDQSPPLAE